MDRATGPYSLIPLAPRGMLAGGNNDWLGGEDLLEHFLDFCPFSDGERGSRRAQAIGSGRDQVESPASASWRRFPGRVLIRVVWQDISAVGRNERDEGGRFLYRSATPRSRAT